MVDQSVSVGMTLTDLERRNTKGHFFRQISLITLVQFDIERLLFGRITRGEGCISTPLPQRGGVPALPNFGGPFYLCVHPLSQNYQILTLNAWEESGVSALHNFGGSIFMPTPFNAEQPNLACHMGTGMF